MENRKFIEKVAYFRVPIRLGEDVFVSGVISPQKEQQFCHSIAAFKSILDAYQIEEYRACATSALREAENRHAVIERTRKATGIDIRPIDGEVEADLIFSNFLVQEIDHSGSYLYIDVGGGSTELTLIKRGERQQSLSLQIGTVRALKGKVKKSEWTRAEQWLQNLQQEESELIAVGTGGNINRIYKEVDRADKHTISRSEIEAYYQYLKGFGYVERIVKLKMKPDRADVIVPASAIIHRLMGLANIQKMMVPKIGLADGIILELFSDWKKSSK